MPFRRATSSVLSFSFCQIRQMYTRAFWGVRRVFPAFPPRFFCSRVRAWVKTRSALSFYSGQGQNRANLVKCSQALHGLRQHKRLHPLIQPASSNAPLERPRLPTGFGKRGFWTKSTFCPVYERQDSLNKQTPRKKPHISVRQDSGTHDKKTGLKDVA